MRRFILSVVLVGVALVVQLSAINGLRLPAGGVPDLVLVVIAALGLAGGPVAGATAGFAAGLCLDLAPPSSGIAGVYALVLCLVGWACGRCRGTLARSALLPIIIAATAAVLGEAMIAGLGMALQPAQVTWNSVRQVLPAALFYDITISPFVLYLVLLASAWLDDAPATAGEARLRRARAQGGVLAAAPSGRAGLAGAAGASGSAGGAVLLGLGGWLAGPPQGRRARKAAARHSPRLSPGSGRARDGWIGGSAAARRALGGAAAGQVLRGRGMRGQAFSGPAFGGHAPGGSAAGRTGRSSKPHGSGAGRLRSGVAGSAAPGQVPRTLAARPVHLRLAGGRKRDGAVGNMLGAGRPALAGIRGRRGDPGRRRRGRGHGFRPSLMPGGSALAGQPRRVPLATTGPARLGSGIFGSRIFGSGRSGFGRPGPARFGAAGLGSARFGSARFGPARFGPARFGSARGRDGVVGGGVLTQRGRTGRAPAAPRFRIRTDRSSAGLRGAGLAGTSRSGFGGTSLAGGGGPQTLHSVRGRAPRRLRMRPRRRDGALGSGGPAGGGRLARSRPSTPRFRARPLASGRPMNGKRPRFGYRRWAIVSVLTRRHGSMIRLWRRPGRRSGGPK